LPQEATCAGVQRYPSDGHVERPFLFPPYRQPSGRHRRHVWGCGCARPDYRSGRARDPGGNAGIEIHGFRFDFGHSSANPFANLSREQRLARLDAVARLLDVAFVLPGTNIRYGIDGIIRLVPVVGDLIASAFSLWLVREARAIGAPWHVTARMLANVALEGAVGMVPVAGDAFDVMFRANMRNMRLLRQWVDRQLR
jgi:Domain of unknown function (DUF4112)